MIFGFITMKKKRVLFEAFTIKSNTFYLNEYLSCRPALNFSFERILLPGKKDLKDVSEHCL